MHMPLKEDPAISARWSEKANPGQAKAIAHLNGPALLLAGAGAGKTFTMLQRTANLIEHGVRPDNVLLVTFTNKAATDIKDRLVKVLGDRGESVIAGTFHSVALRHILKPYLVLDDEFMKSVGLKHDFSIIDAKDAGDILKRSFKLVGEEVGDALEDSKLSVREISQCVGLWRSKGHDDPLVFEEWLAQALKRQLMSLESNAGFTEAYKNKQAKSLKERSFRAKLITKVWKRYHDILRKEMNSIDFDDILSLSAQILERDEVLSRGLAEQLRYMMIDEFQDTNAAQMRIIRQLAKHNRNIVVVGDPCQSIYKFRGADIYNILGFMKEFPDATEVDILVNYRSQSMILETANALSSAMNNGLTKTNLLPAESNIVHSEFARPQFKLCYDDKEEAETALKLIESLRERRPGERVAVLYRSRRAKDELEQRLLQKKIPFEVIGDSTYFDRKEIKDAIAMARFFLYPHDRPAALRFMEATNRLGISDKTLREQINQSGGMLSPYAIFESYAQEARNAKRPSKTSQRAQCLLDAIHYMQATHSGEIPPLSVANDLMMLWRVHLEPALRTHVMGRAAGEQDGNSNMESRTSNVMLLFERIKDELMRGVSMDTVFEDLSLMVDNSAAIQSAHEDNPVQLMTVHASKGLEFTHVLVLGNDMGERELDRLGLKIRNADNMAPEELAKRKEQGQEELEEERRIAYVAMTRAEKTLYLFAVEKRRTVGKDGVSTEPRQLTPFIEEMIGTLRIQGKKPKLSFGGTLPASIQPLQYMESGASQDMRM